MPTCHVRSESPDHLVLEGEREVLKLAPLEGTRLADGGLKALTSAAYAARRDQVLACEREPTRSRRVTMASWLAALSVTASRSCSRMATTSGLSS